MLSVPRAHRAARGGPGGARDLGQAGRGTFDARRTPAPLTVGARWASVAAPAPEPNPVSAPRKAPYPLAGRVDAAHTTIVRFPDTEVTIGGNRVTVIAGPCSVEGYDMLRDVASAVKASGAALLRGGAFKPRTSPYTFSGLGVDALEMLATVRAETGLPVVTEVIDTRLVDTVAMYADVLQIGARNMHNYALLSEVGRLRKPILLKRGFAATIAETVMAAEHIMTQGNTDVILCERGIRSFDTATRNTFDVAAVPVLRKETHLPVFVDPSHAAGRTDIVAALSYAAIAAGADGLIIEVHPQPASALSDADQSLSTSEFDALMRGLAPFVAASGRTLVAPTTGATHPGVAP
ncbi:MAG: 3-deoxy-7-phosphoheptulonate synthase [Gemmatimonadaceae bacterium]|nr:3-deoxy-7-phosphoheptulonate synthase [Gemmatimonadaceae bacterium]